MGRIYFKDKEKFDEFTNAAKTLGADYVDYEDFVDPMMVFKNPSKCRGRDRVAMGMDDAGCIYFGTIDADCDNFLINDENDLYTKKELEWVHRTLGMLLTQKHKSIIQ